MMWKLIDGHGSSLCSAILYCAQLQMYFLTELVSCPAIHEWNGISGNIRLTFHPCACHCHAHQLFLAVQGKSCHVSNYYKLQMSSLVTAMIIMEE